MLGRARFWRVLLSLLASCLAGASARAEEPAAAALNFVRLPGAEDCADGRSLAQRVERELGRQVFTSVASAGIFIEAAASRNDAGYAVTLRIFDAQGKSLGSREVRSDQADCDELSETVALVLAVMVDPEAVLSAMASPEPKPEPESPPPRPMPPREGRARPARRPVAEAQLFTRGAFGFLPELGLGFGLAVSTLSLPYLTLRFEGAGYLDQEVRLAASPGGARLRLLLGGAFACPLRSDRGRFGLLGCAGVEAGAMQSQAFDLDPAERDQTTALVNAAARLAAQLHLYGPTFLTLGGNLSVPLVRALYEATRADGSTGELFEAHAIGLGLDLGLAARF